MEPGSVFHIVDYCILAALLFVSLSIGLFFSLCGAKQQTTKDYLLGGRKMSLFPVAISIVASFVSPITLLGIAADVYYFGIHMGLMFIGQTIAALLSAGLFVPLLYPLKITSSNQYLMKRFRSRIPTLMGTFAQILTWISICGLLTVGPAYVLLTLAQCPTWLTIIIMVIGATLYTTIGGFKAVIWSDVFQATIMVIGMIAITVYTAILAGGFGKSWKLYEEWGRTDIEWVPSPTKRMDIWAVTVVLGIQYTIMFGLNQGSVQRFNSLPTMKKAVSAMLLVIPGTTTFSVLSACLGIAAFGYYTSMGCDPLAAGFIRNPNQIVPAIIKDVLNFPGVPGLCVATIMAGSLSTMSTGLSALSAMTWHDIIKPSTNMSDPKKQLWVTRALVVFFGCLTLGTSFLLMKLGGTLIQLTITITSSLKTPVAVLFFVGAAFPRVNYKSVSLAAFITFLLLGWAALGSQIRGKHVDPLPTETSNCTNLKELNHHRGLYLESASNVTLTVEHSYVFNTDNATDRTELQDTEHKSWLDVVYSINSMWYCPFGIIFGTIVALLLSLIPGFHEEDSIDPAFIFPMLRRFYPDKGYQTCKQSSDELDDIKHNTVCPV